MGYDRSMQTFSVRSLLRQRLWITLVIALTWPVVDMDARAQTSTMTATAYGDAVEVRFVDPALTDPAIDRWLDPYVVMRDPSLTAQGRLFVVLPGSFGSPDRLQLLLRTGAMRGYHVIGLSYPNDWTVNSLCDPTGDPDCFGAVRDEVVTGQDRSPLVSISPSNAITHRLQSVLGYLAATYPAEGWGTFLDSQAQVRWSQVTVGGHSQGGGYAAFLAKQQQVERVCMFSSPLDLIGRGASAQVATWLAQPGPTPPDAYVGLAAEREGGYAQILQSWEVLGIPGALSPVNIDSLTSIHPSLHSLSTDVEPTHPGEYHGSTVNDKYTPVTADGTPVLKPVWEFMCFTGAITHHRVYLPTVFRTP
jgi:hypothetical protein